MAEVGAGERSIACYPAHSVTACHAGGHYLFPEGFTMTKDDLDRQRAAAQSLLGKEPPPVGENASWSNPKTGARGTVTMVDARDVRGRSPCRRIRYEVSTHRVKKPVDIDFTVCRAPDGKWKAAN